MNNILRHIIRIVLLLLLQGLFINNLHWLGVFHPYIYVIGLLMLPMTLPRWAEMLIGAGVGLIMDAICSTAGVHMAACVAICYVRPLLISRLVQESQRISTQTCTNTIGAWQCLTTASVIIVLHHSLVLLLEHWSLAHGWWLIMNIVLSSVVTFVLFFLYDRTQQ